MKARKFFKLIVLMSVIPLVGHTQKIIKNSGHGYCDCYEGNGSALRLEKFDISWGKTDLPKKSVGYWNTLIKEYYCGCNYNSPISFLKSESLYKNGKKHGNWIEYFENAQIKTITSFRDGVLIDKKRFTADGKPYNGKYNGKVFNTTLQRDTIMFIENYSQGILGNGIYYKDDGYPNEKASNTLQVEFKYKKK